MYYLISFVYNQSILYCIWVSSVKDYVITKDKKVLVFNTIEDIEDYEKSSNILIKRNEAIQYDLDKMILWCENKKNITCGCEEILDFWNICSDIASSIKKEFIGNASIYDDLYEKVFYANDLFSNNPIPHTTLLEFSNEEIKNIKKILKNGIKIIVESIVN